MFAFIIGLLILIWAKLSPDGFSVLWRYFAWSNQTIALFAFAIIAIYLLGKGQTTAALMPLLPGMWYCFITFSFICNAKIGFNIPMDLSYILGIAFALVYAFFVYRHGQKFQREKLPVEMDPTVLPL